MEVTNFQSLDLSELYTYADYYSWRFQERVELIKGKVFKMSPAPNRVHQEVALQLTGVFFNHFHDNQCKIYPAPFDVRLPINKTSSDKTETVVQPDLCIVCDLDKLDDRGCFGAPDLVVEILSPGNSKKEMHQKYEVYQEAGVREYWLVNPQDENVIIYLLDEQGEFKGQKPVVDDIPLKSYIFPDLEIKLSELFN